MWKPHSLAMHLVLLLLASLFLALSLNSKLAAQAITEDIQPFEKLPPVVTHAPLDTITSLQNLREALISAFQRYQVARTAKNFERVSLIADALISLLDLTDENAAARRDTSIRTAMALIDIVDEVDASGLSTLPDRKTAILNPQDDYPVPGTPLLIQRMDDGPREGEFLFSSNSSKIAPRFLREIALQSPGRLDDLWSTRMLGISGPIIPGAIVNNLPDALKGIVWGTPAWKIVLSVISVAAAILALSGLNSVMRKRVSAGQMHPKTRRFLFSASTLISFYLLNQFFNYQVFLTGTFARLETLLSTLFIFAMLAWTFWRFMAVLSDSMAERRASSGQYSDESMMRLVNHIIALVGAIWIVAYGLQTLGFPLLSILAGLGVGGLAVALAIRPTLENLISGFVLYLEKSVRVGDYCTFGQQSGTVENIGVRSTHVRALDRTLIAIPNTKFVDMELVNWARCDEMLINTKIGVRYETDTDQLRYILAEIRSVMHGHPRINSDTVRVRFVGYGDSSLDIDIRVYAQTREWNDFYAIQEDVLLRVKQIVEKSGSGFAFPSTTVYISRDDGLDDEKSQKSVDTVGKWRRRRELPFPNFSTKMRDRLENHLRYPPYGSPEFDGPDEEQIAVEEPLSAEADVLEEDMEADEQPSVSEPKDEEAKPS